jgi:hypothetical protein
VKGQGGSVTSRDLAKLLMWVNRGHLVQREFGTQRQLYHVR